MLCHSCAVSLWCVVVAVLLLRSVVVVVALYRLFDVVLWHDTGVLRCCWCGKGISAVFISTLANNVVF